MERGRTKEGGLPGEDTKIKHSPSKVSAAQNSLWFLHQKKKMADNPLPISFYISILTQSLQADSLMERRKIKERRLSEEDTKIHSLPKVSAVQISLEILHEKNRMTDNPLPISFLSLHLHTILIG